MANFVPHDPTGMMAFVNQNNTDKNPEQENSSEMNGHQVEKLELTKAQKAEHEKNLPVHNSNAKKYVIAGIVALLAAAAILAYKFMYDKQSSDS